MSVSLQTVEQLSRRVWRVLGLNPSKYTLQGTNTYLIGTGPDRLLLDTGEADREDYSSLLATTLQQLHARISKIVISHWHHDHLGGLPSVLKTVCGGPGPVVYKLPLRQPLGDKSLHYPLRGEGGEVTLLPSEDGMTYLCDGELLEVEGATLRVVATPGHTTDHLSLWLEEERAVFTADCILGEGTAVFEELGPYMSSLEKLLELRPSMLYPGHGPVLPDGTATIQHYLAHRRAREQQLLDCLELSSVSVTARHLVEIIYKDVDPLLWTGAENNVRLHLDKLHQDGRVQRSRQDDCDVYEWILSSKL